VSLSACDAAASVVTNRLLTGVIGATKTGRLKAGVAFRLMALENMSNVYEGMRIATGKRGERKGEKLFVKFNGYGVGLSAVWESSKLGQQQPTRTHFITRSRHDNATLYFTHNHKAFMSSDKVDSDQNMCESNLIILGGAMWTSQRRKLVDSYVSEMTLHICRSLFSEQNDLKPQILYKINRILNL
jgi:hypothetical protein